MNNFRKLLVLGLNEALGRDLLTLEAPRSDAPTNEDSHAMFEIAGFPSVFLWSSISVGELRISVWWDYDHSNHPQADSPGNSKETFSLSQPLAKRNKYPKFVGATASAWLERKTGKHLQGEGKQGVFHTYLRADMKERLRSMPAPTPIGYQAEGQFFP
ncbi:hypothetical protein [Aureimonas altamirensis]|uniref:hypothetical protein n=1 Tax=Aureimonas altamirensis TaxID=370622 RepID=UPI0025557DD1|nr:hypothetical protein [Aureimonas altamirensis]